MEFRENEAIYLQIADYAGENILLGKWSLNEKISSVRDLAVELQVNPNTVMRAYEFLQGKGVIMNKRGIGFFVENGAKEKIKSYRKERFLGQELPGFFRNLSLLDISMDEIKKRFEAFTLANPQSDQS
ncbi:GntR family transcriptional regulator [Pedobacter nyackensis]|uniref:GntR family transcriptional regulator n=1 Tax=Pedobacter nyackensis TaxID=475255 RepID=UPI00292F4230|nr:GntR family transcriptional regulator [Pedobacter nyackensis]